MKRNERGFTLMELMVVIVIVAVLAAVAVPLYINYVRDAQRTEAKGAIGAIITAEQTFFQRSPEPHRYTVNMAQVNVDLTDVSRNWTFAITSSDDTQNFTVTADGIDGRPTDGLQVRCVYSRTADAVWTEL